jgi:Flp pilus assembly protein TadD
MGSGQRATTGCGQPRWQRQQRFWLASALFFVTLLLYSKSIDYPFINYDDPQYVFQNPHVTRGLSSENISWAFTTGRQSNWHPLTWLSLQVDAEIFGGENAAGYHLTNVLLHAVNAALLFWVWAAMTAAPWRSALLAALFALHPLRVESVVWVSERKDVLSTFFWLLTMAAYLWYVRRPAIHSYAALIAALALGLAAKPMLVTLPFVLLLLDYWPLKRLGDQPTWPRLRRLIFEKLPLLALVIASVAVTVHVQSSGGAVKDLDHFPLAQRIANASVSYVVYALKTLWPTKLAPFYPYVSYSPWDGIVLAAVAALALTTWLCIRRARSAPYLLVGWFWYLGTLVPVLGLVQVGAQARADRYTYIPILGLLLMSVWGISQILSRWAVAKRAGFAAVILGTCAVLTWQQIGFWENNRVLWTHTLEVTGPNNAIAQQNLGIALYEAELPEDALPHLLAGAELDPKRYMPQVILASCLRDLKRDAEAIAPLTHACRLNPTDPQIREELATALARAGREREAFGHYLALTPKNPAAAHLALGLKLLAGQLIGQARTHFEAAVAADSGNAQAHFNLGLALIYEGRPGDAEGPLRQAVLLDSHHGPALTLLGLVLCDRGKLDEAVACCRRAVSVDGQSAVNRSNLAMVLSARGDSKESQRQYLQANGLDPTWRGKALQFARQAAVREPARLGLFLPRCQALQVCQATGYHDSQALMTLAAVEAADGRFVEAVNRLRQARAEVSDPGLLQEIDDQLKLYQSGKSLRGRRLR